MLTQTQRAQLLDQFMQHHEVETLSAEVEDGACFEPSGCDVCNEGATDCYEVEGYSKVHNEVFKLGSICHVCLCVSCNGVED